MVELDLIQEGITFSSQFFSQLEFDKPPKGPPPPKGGSKPATGTPKPDNAGKKHITNPGNQKR